MKARRLAREIALDVLYEGEIKERLALDVLADREREGWLALEVSPHAGELIGEAGPYARGLVEGVAAHQDSIDGLIGRFAERWSLDRMPVVDRNLLRIGIFELLWADVPAAAVISEAVELAKTYSTDSSGRFVNGILGRIADSVVSGEVTRSDPS